MFIPPKLMGMFDLLCSSINSCIAELDLDFPFKSHRLLVPQHHSVSCQHSIFSSTVYALSSHYGHVQNLPTSGFCVTEPWTGTSTRGFSMQLCWMVSASQKGNSSYKISSFTQCCFPCALKGPVQYAHRSPTNILNIAYWLVEMTSLTFNDLCSDRCQQFEY